MNKIRCKPRHSIVRKGLWIDEAMMADSGFISYAEEVLQEHPLLPHKRKPKSLPKFGYRDIILGGDVRQLPPASGRRPYWATDRFYEDFEIFTLLEDRRHEKDPAMQQVKELIAWGGVDNPAEHDIETQWPVAQKAGCLYHILYDPIYSASGVLNKTTSILVQYSPNPTE